MSDSTTLDQSKLTITIDADSCLGEGGCLEDAPTTFRMNACGVAEVCPGSTDSAQQVKMAAQNCPGDAIKLE